MRAEVERRAGELIPPRSQAEARELADLGPMVLELLPGPKDLDEDSAMYTVESACLIGGDAALPFLVRYRGHGSRGVRSRLGAHWDRFDTETYANEILRPLLVGPDTDIVVHSLAELRTLNRLGGADRVELWGDFTPAQILDALDAEKLTRLELIHSPLTDLGFLGRYQKLRTLHLQDCPSMSSLASLAGTPVRILILNDVPGLADMSTLRALSGTPLECLFLPPNAHGLSVLAEFPSLDELRLMLDHELTREDWQTVMSLPQLTSLFLNDDELTHLEVNGHRLENLRTVGLVGMRGSAIRLPMDLRPTVTVFPEMTDLNVHFTDELDLAPLAAHPCLRQVNTPGANRLLNADKLPAHIRLNGVSAAPS